METYNVLKHEYQLAKDKADTLHYQLREMKDGFTYHTVVHSYGSHWKETHNNAIMAQELIDQYYGDNGLVDVYSDNIDGLKHCQGGTTFLPLSKWCNDIYPNDDDE